MFDIISFIREKILRKSKLNHEVVGEELNEKQTTKLGYFLLFCMFIAIMTSVQWTLSIIKDIPSKPTSIPYCITTMVDTFIDSKDNKVINNYSYDYDYNYGYNNYNECHVTSTNPEFNFDPEYSILKEPYYKIVELNKSIDTLNSQKSSVEYTEQKNQNDYNTSLTEKIAGEESGVYDKNKIKNNIQDNRYKITNIDSNITELKTQIDTIKLQNNGNALLLKEKLQKATDDYRTVYLLYKLYVAILSFIFSIIVFIVLYKIYVKQKIKNSPHTIIFSVATFAYGIILLQISCLFIWDIIPHKLLELVLNLFKVFTPLIYLVQFLWPVFIIAIFGFLVYKIQKRLYSPENILKRFITDKKCPNCGNGVDFTKPFCPLCSHEIQIHCNHCNNLTLKGMPYCSNCGGALQKNNK